ncbi:MAG TPA: hypothetical protein VEQ61_06230 [Thermoleophilaceae bacterium]|nr:hypothetical protein [Thermoleophilaceae bacterium]
MRRAAGRGGMIHKARRLWPLALMAWERWQALTPDERERYKRQAREYGERGRNLLERRRPPPSA